MRIKVSIIAVAMGSSLLNWIEKGWCLQRAKARKIVVWDKL
ncbi:hypothetical protein JCM19239_7565 [Vibrio variabilis]|uniref:Uncharacterized protein n=1 Tax=Vibrio variabilis TaxID=990271 RepID=A0ABQ0J4A9_9VIBR|nr:hypothetical protein JCM19239_7565 [Vibrio variabilis]